MKTYLVYALSKSETNPCFEDLLSENITSVDQLAKLLKLAQEQGFHSFRVVEVKLDKPNFNQSIKMTKSNQSNQLKKFKLETYFQEWGFCVVEAKTEDEAREIWYESMCGEAEITHSEYEIIGSEEVK